MATLAVSVCPSLILLYQGWGQSKAQGVLTLTGSENSLLAFVFIYQVSSSQILCVNIYNNCHIQWEKWTEPFSSQQVITSCLHKAQRMGQSAFDGSYTSLKISSCKFYRISGEVGGNVTVNLTWWPEQTDHMFIQFRVDTVLYYLNYRGPSCQFATSGVWRI